jgi:hypothetical protein
MIDVIVNEAGGVMVAHDERQLDGCDTLEITSEGQATLSGGAFTRQIGLLKRPLLDRVRPGAASWLLRTNNWSLAHMGPLTVRSTLAEV